MWQRRNNRCGKTWKIAHRLLIVLPILPRFSYGFTAVKWINLYRASPMMHRQNEPENTVTELHKLPHLIHNQYAMELCVSIDAYCGYTG